MRNKFQKLMAEWKKMSSDDQQAFRELVVGFDNDTGIEETVSQVTTDKETKNGEKSGDNSMKETQIPAKATDKTATDQTAGTETGEANKDGNGEKAMADGADTAEGAMANEPEKAMQEVEQGEVESVTEEQNAIRVEDLVLKEDLDARLNALEAKFSSVLSENEALKDELAKVKGKYEGTDFGNQAGKTMKTTGAKSDRYETFDEYMEKFNR